MTIMMMMMILQNVKAVFDAAIKVVLQPPSKTKKQKRRFGFCHALWSQASLACFKKYVYVYSVLLSS